MAKNDNKDTQKANEAAETQRKGRYRVNADGTIDTSDLTPEEIEKLNTSLKAAGETLQDVSETLQQTLKALSDALRESVTLAAEQIDNLDAHPETIELRQLFPDFDAFIKSERESKNGMNALALWVSILLPILNNFDSFKAYIKEINYTGTLEDFIKPAQDPETGERLPSLYDTWEITLPEVAEELARFTEGGTRRALEHEEPAPISQTNYLNLPSSNVTDLILSLLGSGGDLRNMIDRKAEVSHGAEYKIATNKAGTKMRIDRETPEESLMLELTAGKISGKNKSVTKLFVLSLVTANRQAMHNGRLTRDYITFPLSELVNLGIYKTEKSARKGFMLCMDALTDLKAAQRQKRRKNNNTLSDNGGISVLFTDGYIIDGQCYVYLNTKIHWERIAEFFTFIPPYYFKLSKRASDLVLYIFYLARQNTDKIKRQGYFTISFKAIQARLNLPDETDNKNPARDIKEPIESAIVEIEDANSAAYNNTDFTLLPVYDDTAPIADFLNKGFLKVSFEGDLKQSFIELQKNREKKIAATARKKQKQLEQRKK